MKTWFETARDEGVESGDLRRLRLMVRRMLERRKQAPLLPAQLALFEQLDSGANLAELEFLSSPTA